MTARKPEIVITYCTQCQWLLRAAWLAQELLSTFGDDLGKVSLVPGTSDTLPRSSPKVLSSSCASHAARNSHWHCVQ